jgi:hypothetical protein
MEEEEEEEEANHKPLSKKTDPTEGPPRRVSNAEIEGLRDQVASQLRLILGLQKSIVRLRRSEQRALHREAAKRDAASKPARLTTSILVKRPITTSQGESSNNKRKRGPDPKPQPKQPKHVRYADEADADDDEVSDYVNEKFQDMIEEQGVPFKDNKDATTTTKTTPPTIKKEARGKRPRHVPHRNTTTTTTHAGEHHLPSPFRAPY